MVVVVLVLLKRVVDVLVLLNIVIVLVLLKNICKKVTVESLPYTPYMSNYACTALKAYAKLHCT